LALLKENILVSTTVHKVLTIFPLHLE